MQQNTNLFYQNFLTVASTWLSFEAKFTREIIYYLCKHFFTLQSQAGHETTLNNNQEIWFCNTKTFLARRDDWGRKMPHFFMTFWHKSWPFWKTTLKNPVKFQQQHQSIFVKFLFREPILKIFFYLKFWWIQKMIKNDD